MPDCPMCGSETGLTPRLVDSRVNWESFEYMGVGDSAYNSLLDEVVELAGYYGGDTDSYGYVDDESAWIVVKIDGRFFKKEGVRSSYSGLNWTGDCREVKAQTKTVYEFV